MPNSRLQRAKPFAGAIAALLLGGMAADAQASCDKPVAIRFATGRSAGDVSGGVPRGYPDCYTLGARASQRLTITQAHGPDHNIVFQVYQPGWKITHDADGLVFAGATLPGAGEGDDAPKWTGPLPADGTYLLVIGTTRGGGPYRVHVEIR